MTRDAFVRQMQLYMPEQACALVYNWIEAYPVFIRITKPRRTKLGDYRPKGKNGMPTITVNGNLNPYSFLITFTHEIAHHHDYCQRKTLKNPHGATWKKVYSNLLEELLIERCFPIDLEPKVRNHISNPKAASCSDSLLLAKLNEFNDEQALRLMDLEEGSSFRIVSNHRVFRKGQLKRTRFRCQEISSSRYFMVHGQCEVELINS